MPALRKKLNPHTNKLALEPTPLLQHILRNLYSFRTQRRNGNISKRRVLQGRMGIGSSNHRRTISCNSLNHSHLHKTRKPQISRSIQTWTCRHIPRGLYSGRNKLEIQHPRRRNYDSVRWTEQNKKGNGLRDKILMPLQSLRPQLSNWPQDPKIPLNMVLETCQRPSGRPNWPLRQMGLTKCGMWQSSKTET